MFNDNVVLNGGKWTHFEYVWYFAHKVFDKMSQWQFYENYIEWCLGYDGNDVHKLYWNDDYIEWFYV